MSGDHLRLELRGARVVFTTRRGGCSTGPYASLNLGQFTDDDPAAVQRNRASLEDQLGVELASGHQVHGARIVVAEPAESEPPQADGQVTTSAGVAPMVLTADCLPVA